MRTQLPQRIYLLGILPYVFPPIRWVMENVGTNTAWWSAHVQPILEPFLWPAAPAFLLGIIFQDVSKRDSWIRANWRLWTRKFEIVSLSVGYAEEPRRLNVRASIRFVRNIRSARLILRVYSCTNAAIGPFIHVINVGDLTNISKHETRPIEVGNLAIAYPGWSPVHSSWGPGPPDHTRSLIGGSKNVVEIELTGTLIPQGHRVFVANLAYGSPQAMPALYVQDEDEDVFSVRAVV